MLEAFEIIFKGFLVILSMSAFYQGTMFVWKRRNKKNKRK